MSPHLPLLNVRTTNERTTPQLGLRRLENLPPSGYSAFMEPLTRWERTTERAALEALYEDVVSIASGSADTIEHVARRLFFRHDPVWLALLRGARESTFGNAASARSIPEVIACLHALVNCYPTDHADRGVRRAIRDVSAVLEQPPEERNIALRMLKERWRAFLQQEPWLIPSIEPAETFMSVVATAASGFGFYDPYRCVEAFFWHFVCGDDLDGAQGFRIERSSSEFGEPLVRIEVTSARLLSALLGSKELREHKKEYLPYLGKVGRRDMLAHAARVFAVELIHRRRFLERHDPAIESWSGALERWNRLASVERIDLGATSGRTEELHEENRDRALKRHGPYLAPLTEVADELVPAWAPRLGVGVRFPSRAAVDFELLRGSDPRLRR